MGPVAPAAPKPGSVFAGKYRVEHELGRGGMGIVYACHHLHLDQPVALKVMRASPLDEVRTQRLLQEARATARLRSPHVVRLLDADVLPSGEAYLAMERLEGETLQSWLERRAPLPVELAVRFARQVCEVLVEAEAIGVVHRDLKPANLFVIPSGGAAPMLKVLDFGISKLLDESQHGAVVTSTEAVLGSPPYMSPEQLLSTHQVDCRSDVWSLGVVLFEMLAGQRPFTGATAFEICENIVHGRPCPLAKLAPSVPLELSAIVSRCLEKSPDRRYPSARVLSEALAAFAESVPLPAPEVSHRSEATVTVPLAARNEPRAAGPARVARWLALVAFIVVIAVLVRFAAQGGHVAELPPPRAAVESALVVTSPVVAEAVAPEAVVAEAVAPEVVTRQTPAPARSSKPAPPLSRRPRISEATPAVPELGIPGQRSRE